MIITWLVMHRNNIRNAMGAAAGVGGFYVTALTIFIKSSVLYAVSFLLYVGTLAAESPLEYPFMQILVQTQVHLVSRFFCPSTAISGHDSLTVVSTRLLHNFSLPCESPTGGH